MSNYLENVFEVLKASLNLNDEKIFDTTRIDEIRENLNSGEYELPAVIIYEDKNYVPIINQSNLDLNNEVRTNIGFDIMIFSYDIDELVSLENKLINSLNIKENSIDNESIHSPVLYYDSEIPISRKTFTVKNGKEEYRSVIHIKYDGVILSKMNVNPVKMDLDKKYQAQVMKRLSLLNGVYNLIENQIEKAVGFNDKNGNSSFEEKISKMAPSIKTKYQELENQISSLKEQINSIYTFKNLCKQEISLEDSGFIECYSYIIDKKLDITNATEEYKQRIINDEEKRRNEEERIQKIRTKYNNMKDDKSLNEYTDAVIADIKSKLKTEYEISIYGGSTYFNWYRLWEEGVIKFPCILINPIFNYAFDNKNYTNVNSDGLSVVHSYNTNALPVYYGIQLLIFSKDKQQSEEITEQIKNQYSNEVTVFIDDTAFQKEKRPVKLSVDSNKEIRNDSFNNYGGVYRIIIDFNRNPSVYYLRDFDASETEKNQKMQVRILQQAEFMCFCASKLDSAIKQLDTTYKNLVNGKTSMFGLFESANYKKLKSSFILGASHVDKTLFDSELNIITRVYPNLYDKMTQGMSYEQIREDINNYYVFFNTKTQELCKMLQIPTTHISEKGLKFYIQKMNDLNCTLNSAGEEYEKLLQEEKIEEQRRLDEAGEVLDEWIAGHRERRNSVLNTAFGVALGNKMSQRGQKKKEPTFTVCPFSCPRHGTDKYGRRKCNIDPKKCSKTTLI